MSKPSDLGKLVDPTADEVLGILLGAFQTVTDAQTPCWECSSGEGEVGFFLGSRENPDGSKPGGYFECGKYGCVARTLHDSTGACVNCSHVTTEEEARQLSERSRLNGSLPETEDAK
jgi:hypothetical protein